ncbi:hypothetical protein PWG15_21600 (plasmid) [Ensifer adhaerens]|uniref:hypothetical protein n=1 Tax=Ensifer adhaerens TaxID=106592 RepID=UPI0023A96609|nr:hypothetical protein [Ensifer adhaerens]WDZ80391.1 hypothetical protein PWG15_21600 [Ensifer adhaerens]
MKNRKPSKSKIACFGCRPRWYFSKASIPSFLRSAFAGMSFVWKGGMAEAQRLCLRRDEAMLAAELRRRRDRF